MDLDAFKAAQRQMWADGDYRPIGRALAPAAHILVDRAGVTQGQRVLDVATGAGSVAVAAARAGADVVGLDITDAWFEEARYAAQAARVELALVVGDVERLPVRTEAFDVVLSSFGAIFAPRHHVVAAELVRVCRRGGTIGLTAWTPEGASYTMMSTLELSTIVFSNASADSNSMPNDGRSNTASTSCEANTSRTWAGSPQRIDGVANAGGGGNPAVTASTICAVPSTSSTSGSRHVRTSAARRRRQTKPPTGAIGSRGTAC